MRQCIFILLIFGLTKPIFSNNASTLSVCNKCHGPQGVSTHPKYPNLAGQHKGYFLKQLQDMNNRPSPCPFNMTSLLEQLNEKDIDELGSLYAKMPIHESHQKMKGNLRGKQLYTTGDYNKHITACIICHGPHGLGNQDAGFPVLAGQSRFYIVEELQAFKSGRRTNDLNHVMQDISKQMSLEDMKAVAKYIEHF